MKKGTASSIYRSDIFTFQISNAMSVPGRFIQIVLEQTCPPLTDAQDIVPFLQSAGNDCLDTGIQSGYISAAGKNTYRFEHCFQLTRNMDDTLYILDMQHAYLPNYCVAQLTTSLRVTMHISSVPTLIKPR
jgi:hypothetical protein